MITGLGSKVICNVLKKYNEMYRSTATIKYISVEKSHFHSEKLKMIFTLKTNLYVNCVSGLSPLHHLLTEAMFLIWEGVIYKITICTLDFNDCFTFTYLYLVGG